MTESILDFDNDKEFPLATVFYCLKITGLWTHVVLVRTHYFHSTIVEANNDSTPSEFLSKYYSLPNT